MKGSRLLFAVALVAAVTLGACGASDSDGGGIKVVVTTSIIGDLVSNVAGSDATVEVLMPLGADPHSFSPSSQQVAEMNEADLVVANGLGLEESFTSVLEGVRSDGGRVLELGPMLDPIPFDVNDQQEDGDDDHSTDPHVWMDPLRMADAAVLIAAELSEIDSEVDWMDRGAAYASDLQELHAEIEDELSAVGDDDRRLVTNHDALGYFADRYDFEVIGTVIPGGSTLGDPSSEALASLVATMRALDVTVVFAETTQPSALAEAVAREMGGEVRVVELFTGSLGEPGSGAETLIDMLRTDASRIAQALGS